MPRGLHALLGLAMVLSRSEILGMTIKNSRIDKLFVKFRTNNLNGGTWTKKIYAPIFWCPLHWIDPSVKNTQIISLMMHKSFKYSFNHVKSPLLNPNAVCLNGRMQERKEKVQMKLKQKKSNHNICLWSTSIQGTATKQVLKTQQQQQKKFFHFCVILTKIKWRNCGWN